MKEPNALLMHIRDLEERVEALEVAFQSLLFGEEVQAEYEGRTPLAELAEPSYDDYQTRDEDPAVSRRRRVLERAIALISEARPGPIVLSGLRASNPDADGDEK